MGYYLRVTFVQNVGDTPNGYCMSVDWDSHTEFDTCPAFGKPCSTYTVHFVVD